MLELVYYLSLIRKIDLLWQHVTGVYSSVLFPKEIWKISILSDFLEEYRIMSFYLEVWDISRFLRRISSPVWWCRVEPGEVSQWDCAVLWRLYKKLNFTNALKMFEELLCKQFSTFLMDLWHFWEWFNGSAFKCNFYVPNNIYNVCKISRIK